jgi:hypothetical protein
LFLFIGQKRQHPGRRRRTLFSRSAVADCLGSDSSFFEAQPFMVLVSDRGRRRCRCPAVLASVGGIGRYVWQPQLCRRLWRMSWLAGWLSALQQLFVVSRTIMDYRSRQQELVPRPLQPPCSSFIMQRHGLSHQLGSLRRNWQMSAQHQLCCQR